MRHHWNRMLDLLPPGGRRSAVALALESLIAGLLEAAMLVLVVNAALVIANAGGAAELDLPLLDSLELSPGSALAFAGAAGALSLILHLDIARLTAKLSASVLESARERAITSFAAASWACQAEEREGSLQETVSTLSMQSSTLLLYLANFASSAIGLAALFAAALVVNPVVTAIVLLFGIGLFLILRPLGRLTRQRANHFVRVNSEFAEGVAQWGSLAMELRIFGVEEAQAAALLTVNRESGHALARTRFMSRSGALLFHDVAILFMVGALGAVYSLSDIDLAAVGAIVLLIVRSLSYARQVQMSMQQINEQAPNLDALMTRLERLEAEAVSFGVGEPTRVTPVELCSVGYDYSALRTGIEDVTLRIDDGEIIGVVGPSGGGKSTLVQVLLRLRPPSRGRVLAGGGPYERYSAERWSRLVSLVPQEPKLFQGTVLDNIAFFRRGFTRSEVEAAAAAAHVLDEIRRLPDGLDTVLGPRGAGLSGGQRQRICIARALLGQPQVLIMDEPTSALDTRSEELLQDTIEGLRGRMAMVLVAHRLTTLSVCDRVVGFKDGRVQVIGTLAEATATLNASVPESDEEVTAE